MTLRFELGTDAASDRVDKVLARLCAGTSRSTIQRWIREERVRIDGRPCRPRDEVGPGHVLEVEPGPPPPSAAAPDSSVEFGVVYEDDDLLVVDKPAGLVVHPARGNLERTLVNGLLARSSFRATFDPRDQTGALRPGIVHRIDKDTSGLLVVAKNDAAREGLKEQLAAHTVERRYRALTIGVPTKRSIRTAYGRDPRSRLRFTSRVREGKPAITHVAVLEVLAGGAAALVECRLETGRTHQIRVHLSEQCNTPLLGDALYRRSRVPEALMEAAARIGRQALHAAVLGFDHPRTGAHLRFESPLPEDFAGALALLRAGS
ncbi:MAG TPA: RluA family pseudouridine synthase [Polyangiaceae bacterium]|nr:RluA family pseudouridine synthase [Polyangiaceae bacterium]